MTRLKATKTYPRRVNLVSTASGLPPSFRKPAEGLNNRQARVITVNCDSSTRISPGPTCLNFNRKDGVR